MSNADRTWRERIENPGLEDGNRFGISVEELFDWLEEEVIKLVKIVHGILIWRYSGNRKIICGQQKIARTGLSKAYP